VLNVDPDNFDYHLKSTPYFYEIYVKIYVKINFKNFENSHPFCRLRVRPC